MNKIGENTYHMMQKEIEKKNGVIKKLKIELNSKSKDPYITKKDLENFLVKKITDLVTEAKQIVKDGIRQTKEFMNETLKESSHKTYAEIAKVQKESLESEKEQKEENEKEERDIKSRKRNIIIHGVLESMKDTKECEQESDKSEIQDLFDEIGTNRIDFTHHRIGVRKDKISKSRPIKVTFQNVYDKEKIMSNLHHLKNLGYIGLSITDDFSINERKKIKAMCQEAKRKTADSGGDFIWRVRGSPRTSLYFIKTSREIFDNSAKQKRLTSLEIKELLEED